MEFARRREAALFVSLHADSAPGARGASVYTLAETASDAMTEALARRENRADLAGGLRLPSVSPEVQRILISLMRQETRAGSARIARLAVRELGEEVPLLPNTHREAAFVVLKAPEIPSALVELGFLSDPRDEAALRRPDHRARLARGAGAGGAAAGWRPDAAGRGAGGAADRGPITPRLSRARSGRASPAAGWSQGVARNRVSAGVILESAFAPTRRSIPPA